MTRHRLSPDFRDQTTIESDAIQQARHLMAQNSGRLSLYAESVFKPIFEELERFNWRIRLPSYISNRVRQRSVS
ncbi:hypothetical protein VCV18_004414 [Metarhizium anisopliae]